MTAVHQLLPVYSPGDAVGQVVRRVRGALRSAGVRSEVYAELIHQSLQREARPAQLLEAETRPDDIVLYHLSIGAQCAGTFAAIPCRHVLAYHNITPREFFAEVSPRVAYWIDRGRRDLAALAPLVELGIADSVYNEVELRAAGCSETVVIPPPVDFARLSPRPSRPAHPPVLLCVSRLAPNKRQQDLIRVLAALREDFQPQATLTLVGGSDDTQSFAGGLSRLSRDLGVDEAVTMRGRLSDPEVGEQYARASVVACASVHEGFGMPLLEAMAFDVPVVAYASAAVPETVGDAAILLANKDPLVWAAVIDRLIRDTQLRRTLIERGRNLLRGHSGPAFEARFSNAMERLGLALRAG